MNDPYKEEDDSDGITAIEGSDAHIATAYKPFINNPLQCITTANQLFNANPFERITKETGKHQKKAKEICYLQVWISRFDQKVLCLPVLNVTAPLCSFS
jgi:hypothetical protein